MYKEFFHSIWVGIKWFLSRGIVFYLVAIFLTHTFINYKMVTSGLMARILNAYMPASFEFLVSHIEKGKFPKDILANYTFYFTKLVEAFPKNADAHGMLGFCYFHSRKIDNAISEYKKACELQPKVFWFYYNLGIIYFKMANYQEAINYFNKANETNWEDTIEFIRSSKVVYFLIFRDTNISYADLQQRINSAKFKSNFLLAISLKMLGRVEEASNVIKKLAIKGDIVLNQEEVFIQLF